VRGIFSADPKIVGTNSASPSLSTEVSKNELKTNQKSAADGYPKTMKMPEPTPGPNSPPPLPSPLGRGKRGMGESLVAQTAVLRSAAFPWSLGRAADSTARSTEQSQNVYENKAQGQKVGSMHFTQGEMVSSYATTALNYLGQPSGGLRFVRDFLIAARQPPCSFKTSALGPGLDFGFSGFGFRIWDTTYLRFLIRRTSTMMPYMIARQSGIGSRKRSERTISRA